MSNDDEKGEVSKMTGKFRSVKHQLIFLDYSRPGTGSMTYQETWFWDVYTVDLDGSAMVRCECTKGRDVSIPWFETKEVNLDEIVREACLAKMKSSIG